LSEDIRRFLEKSPENRAAGDRFKTRVSAFLTPQLMSLAGHRAAHWLHVNGLTRTARLVSGLNFLLHKVSITPDSCIGPGCHLPHPTGLCFSGIAGRGLTLYSLSFCGPREDGLASGASPRLGDRVTLGGQAIVLGAVSIGSDTKIAPRVTLSADAPSGVLVVSRVLRPRRGSLGRRTA
jgi:serine O-acetyltransferase